MSEKGFMDHSKIIDTMHCSTGEMYGSSHGDNHITSERIQISRISFNPVA